MPAIRAQKGTPSTKDTTKESGKPLKCAKSSPEAGVSDVSGNGAGMSTVAGSRSSGIRCGLT